MKTERPTLQYHHLQKLDEAVDKFKLVSKIFPHSISEELAKRKIFHHYYGATRIVMRDSAGDLQIVKDYEIINILSGRGVDIGLKKW